MYNTRIKFGMDNFIEKDYFLPMAGYPKALVSPIGEKATNAKRDEWDKNIIKIIIDEPIIFPHKPIKMDRDMEGILQGTLNIKKTSNQHKTL